MGSVGNLQTFKYKLNTRDYLKLSAEVLVWVHMNTLCISLKCNVFE